MGCDGEQMPGRAAVLMAQARTVMVLTYVANFHYPPAVITLVLHHLQVVGVQLPACQG